METYIVTIPSSSYKNKEEKYLHIMDVGYARMLLTDFFCVQGIVLYRQLFNFEQQSAAESAPHTIFVRNSGLNMTQ